MSHDAHSNSFQRALENRKSESTSLNRVYSRVEFPPEDQHSRPPADPSATGEKAQSDDKGETFADDLPPNATGPTASGPGDDPPAFEEDLDKTEFIDGEFVPPAKTPTRASTQRVAAALTRSPLVAVVSRVAAEPIALAGIEQARGVSGDFRKLRENSFTRRGNAEALLRDLESLSRDGRPVLYASVESLESEDLLMALLQDDWAERVIEALRKADAILVLAVRFTKPVSPARLYRGLDEARWVVTADWKAELLHRWGQHRGVTAQDVQAFTKGLNERRLTGVDERLLHQRLEEFEEARLRPMDHSGGLIAAFEKLLDDLLANSSDAERDQRLRDCLGGGAERLLEKVAFVLATLVPGLGFSEFAALGRIVLENRTVEEVTWLTGRRTVDGDGRETVEREETRVQGHAVQIWTDRLDHVLDAADIMIAEREGRRSVFLARQWDAEQIERILSSKYPSLVYQLADTVIDQQALFQTTGTVQTAVARFLAKIADFARDRYGTDLVGLLLNQAAAMAAERNRWRGQVDRHFRDASSGIAAVIDAMWPAADQATRRRIRLQLDPGEIRTGGELGRFLRFLHVETILRIQHIPDANTLNLLRGHLDRGDADLYALVRQKRLMPLLRAPRPRWRGLGEVGPWLNARTGDGAWPRSALLANELWIRALLEEVGNVRAPYTANAARTTGLIVLEDPRRSKAFLGHLFEVDWTLVGGAGIDPALVIGSMMLMLMRGIDRKILERDAVIDGLWNCCLSAFGEAHEAAYGDEGLSASRIDERLSRLSRLADEIRALAEVDPLKAQKAFDQALEHEEFRKGLEADLAVLKRLTEVAVWPLTLYRGLLLAEWCFEQTGVEADECLRESGLVEDRRVLSEFLDVLVDTVPPAALKRLAGEWLVLRRLLLDLRVRVRDIDSRPLQPHEANRLALVLQAKAEKLKRLLNGLNRRLKEAA